MYTTWKYCMCVPYMKILQMKMDSDFEKNWVGVIIIGLPVTDVAWTSNVCHVPLWNFSTRNRVTPVSIQDGVWHGITFAAISTIPAAPSPISAGLSPIPAALLRFLRWLAAAKSPIVVRLAKHHKTLLNIVKHHETHVKHCDRLHRKTSWTTSKTSWNT